MLQLLDGVRPLERLSGLIVASDEVQDRLLQLVETSEMDGLQELAFPMERFMPVLSSPMALFGKAPVYT